MTPPLEIHRCPTYLGISRVTGVVFQIVRHVFVILFKLCDMYLLFCSNCATCICYFVQIVRHVFVIFFNVDEDELYSNVGV